MFLAADGSESRQEGGDGTFLCSGAAPVITCVPVGQRKCCRSLNWPEPLHLELDGRLDHEEHVRALRLSKRVVGDPDERHRYGAATTDGW